MHEYRIAMNEETCKMQPKGCGAGLIFEFNIVVVGGGVGVVDAKSKTEQ